MIRVTHVSSCLGLILAIVTPFLLSAQDPVLRLRSGDVVLEKRSGEELASTLDQVKRGARGESYLILQWERMLSGIEMAQLEAQGVELLAYIPDNAHLCRLPADVQLPVVSSLPFYSFTEIKSAYKLHPQLGEEGPWIVKMMPGISPETLLHSGLQPELLNSDDLPADCRRVAINSTQLKALAAMPSVLYIYPDQGPPAGLREYSEAAQRVSVLKSNLYGLSGEGVTVGVGDGGNIGTHIDLNGHLTDLSVGNPSSHAAHVSGIVAGKALLDPAAGEGMAPDAHLLSQNFSQIINLADRYRLDYDMVITNNSYGNQLGNCDIAGDYNFFSEAVDRQIIDNFDLLHVFAAGNDGDLTCAPYTDGYGTVLSAWQTAKNTLVVGNINHLNSLRPGSSRGPTKDGRLKPELVAVGTGVLSTNRDNNYRRLSGTSMAAPQVSGISALLYQFYRRLHGVNPPSALIKLALVNTTDDLGNPGPDYLFGFGRVNAERAARLLEEGRYESGDIGQGESRTFEIQVPPGQHSAKIMLYWHDREGAPFSIPVLVNDLDLVVEKNGSNWLPYVLETLPDSVGNLATTGEDHINNIEQVEIFFPEAGSYTVTVTGNQVPMGILPFHLAWDFLPEGMELKYPIGGEKWQPGEEQAIRWYSNLPEGSQLRIEYSPDGGDNWQTITDSIIASQGIFLWTVPTEFTTEALIRISSETFSLESVSGEFQILPVPVAISADPLCLGYSYIHWPDVPGVDSFAVYRLEGEEMVELGTTTDTSFIDEGLEAGEEYWYSVSVVNHGERGMRGIARQVQIGSENCEWDLDLALTGYSGEVFGRLHSGMAFDGSDAISVQVANTGSDTIHSYTISYRVGQGSLISEEVDSTLVPGQEHIFRFAQKADFSAPGEYPLLLIADLLGDEHRANDSLSLIVRQVENPPIVLPYTEDFESALRLGTGQTSYGTAGIDRLDYLEGINGRLRTFAGSGYASSGEKALTLDAFPNGSTGDHFARLTFNLQDYRDEDGLRMNFKFMHHEQQLDFDENDRIWIRGHDSLPWIEVYDINERKEERGVYIYERFGINIPKILAQNGQEAGPAFQVALEQSGEGRTNVPGQFNGLSFDDIEFFLVENDVRPLSLLYPERTNCGISSEELLVEIENTSPDTARQIAVQYRVDGGAFSDPVMVDIAGGETAEVLLPAYDFSAFGKYELEIAVSYPPDTYLANDTLRRLQVYNYPLIENFPHVENFETSNGGWYAEGENSSWEWGVPGGDDIDRAAEGTNAWVTGLEGDYNDLERSYLYSPCFDLSGMSNAWISFAHSYALENNFDYLWIEYSEDGIHWFKMGSASQGQNWYNEQGRNAWDGFHTEWHVASLPVFIHPITDRSRIRFRFVLDSDTFVNEEGVGIDLFHVYDHIPIDTSSGVYDAEQDGGRLHFVRNNMLTASVSPASAVAAGTAASSYKVEPIVTIDTLIRDTIIQDTLYSDTIVERTVFVALSDGSETYLPHSWRVTGDLTGAAELRLYLTEEEVLEFLGDSCALCDPSKGPFDLVVSQFSGVNEDSVLQNNVGNGYRLHSGADILTIPYGNGYELRFITDRFSEFYIHSSELENVYGGILEWSATRNLDTVWIGWSGTHELDVLHYIVEMSSDSFVAESIAVDTVAGLNQPGLIQPYESIHLLDTLVTGNTIWYRIRAVRMNSDSFYTIPVAITVTSSSEPAVRKGWKLYPNPTEGQFKLSWTGDGDPEAIVDLVDASGRQLLSRQVNGSVEFNLDVPPGLYYIRIWQGEELVVRKLVVQ